MAYTRINIDTLEDQAAKFGLQSQEARFPRRELEAERIGMGHYRVRPGQRLEFGHRHRSMEEAYVVLEGSGRFRVDDETFDVARHDVIRVDPGFTGKRPPGFGVTIDPVDQDHRDRLTNLLLRASGFRAGGRLP